MIWAITESTPSMSGNDGLCFFKVGGSRSARKKRPREGCKCRERIRYWMNDVLECGIWNLRFDRQVVLQNKLRDTFQILASCLVPHLCSIDSTFVTVIILYCQTWIVGYQTCVCSCMHVTALSSLSDSGAIHSDPVGPNSVISPPINKGLELYINNKKDACQVLRVWVLCIIYRTAYFLYSSTTGLQYYTQCRTAAP